jgi:hypothetical protein
MTKKYFFRFIVLSLFTVHLSLFSCTGRNSPNLPEAKLSALMNEIFLKPTETSAFVLPDSNYVPSAGVKYKEIRAIDQFAPPEISQHVAGSALEGKFVLGNWIETSRFVFLHYTEGRDYPNRRREGKVKDHWAIYDKTAKSLTHHLSSEERVMYENDIEPVGMPFYPTGVNHRGEMYMTFSKQQVADYIASGRYRNDQLQAIYDSMPDDGFCLMTVK